MFIDSVVQQVDFKPPQILRSFATLVASVLRPIKMACGQVPERSGLSPESACYLVDPPKEILGNTTLTLPLTPVLVEAFDLTSRLALAPALALTPTLTFGKVTFGALMETLAPPFTVALAGAGVFALIATA